MRTVMDRLQTIGRESGIETGYVRNARAATTLIN